MSRFLILSIWIHLLVLGCHTQTIKWTITLEILRRLLIHTHFFWRWEMTMRNWFEA